MLPVHRDGGLERQAIKHPLNVRQRWLTGLVEVALRLGHLHLRLV
jgi:hypothetical protein